METYTPENLQLWATPDDWTGTPWHNHYVFLLRHRDSSLIEQSNFICALNQLGGESETVHVVREGHWAVGWIEWIAIHETDSKALETADEIAATLSEYPVLDDCHYSDMENDAATEYWENANISERIEWCKDAGESVFAARHDAMNLALFDVVREHVVA